MQEWVGIVRRESVRLGDHWLDGVSAERLRNGEFFWGGRGGG